MNRSYKLVTVSGLTTSLAFIVALFGAKNIVAAGISRSTDNAMVIASIPADKIVDGNIEGLPEDVSIATIKDIEGRTIKKLKLDTVRWAQIARTVRRNGIYGITGDARLQDAPSFQELGRQMSQKELPAFDTVFGHIKVAKNTWTNKNNEAPRLTYVNANPLIEFRPEETGIVLGTVDSQSTQFVSYGDYYQWTDGTSANLDGVKTIFDAGDTIQSMSHIKNGRLVVNTVSSHLILDLTPLRKGQDAACLSKDDTKTDANFVGQHTDADKLTTFVSAKEQTADGLSVDLDWVQATELEGPLKDYAQAA